MTFFIPCIHEIIQRIVFSIDIVKVSVSDSYTDEAAEAVLHL